MGQRSGRTGGRAAPTRLVIILLATSVGLLAASMLMGQALLWLIGGRTWSWLAPALGLSVLVVIAGPVQIIPGRAATVFAILCAVLIASAWVVLRRRQLWPDWVGVLAGLPVMAVAAIPFAAAGWSGILGKSFNNDMANHLAQTEGMRPGGPNDLLVWDGLGYPVGPHSLVASIATGTGAPSALVFSAFSMALPVILGWTGLHALRNGFRWSAFPTALLIGMPFLVAAYYAQGAFKETSMAILFLASMLLLWRPPRTAPLARWVPYAVILAGALAIYSYAGLTWPIALLGAWAVVRAGIVLWRTHSPAAFVAAVRRNAAPALVAVGVVLVASAPLLSRIYRFWQWEGVPLDNIGNLVGPLPFWEVLGAWNSNDFRMDGPYSSTVTLTGMAIAIAVVLGAAWALRRGEWVTVLAPGVAIAIWIWTDQTQSAYVTAKALAIMAPALMLLAIRPCVERGGPGPAQRVLWKPVAAAALVLLQFQSTIGVLRASPVGPLDMPDEIQGLAQEIGDRPTLYLGNDDFTPWLFRGTPVQSPVIATPMMAFREGKPFEYGQTYDIDSLDPATLNDVDFIVSPRDPASSSIPEAFTRVRSTPHFDLYRRDRPVTPRAILPGETGSAAGARLDCNSAAGVRIIAGGGVAGLRPPEVVRPGATLRPGETWSMSLPLTSGRWRITMSYVSARPVHVDSRDLGIDVQMDPYLGRPGPRFPVADVTVRTSGAYTLRFTPVTTVLTPNDGPAGAILTYLTSVNATRETDAETVPVSEACGRIVDWYVPAAR